ncbi:hypothetical protein ANN_19449 [Periplaneta americana]|uniref:Uncharacterized protein n=1 Tax=Periplaneta americana TaxID=6978 RepID=A0ABQ8S9Y2_PERAM|nr:hypothetical protein ANN_19449 [Periplaneta americana]
MLLQMESTVSQEVDNVWLTWEETIFELFENHGRQFHVIHQHSHTDATKPTSDCSRINETYPWHWIGRVGVISWPPRSPDPTPLDYFVWDWLKSEVYKRQVETREELLAFYMLVLK